MNGEREIIASAIQGEASAFGLLYDEYLSKIYRFIRVKVSRREDAEDLTHHVFQKAWNTIRTYEDKGFPFSAWLYAIARNTLKDFYRASRPIESLGEDEEDEIPGTEDIEAEVGEKMNLELVMEAIRKLPTEQQDILLLRFVEDLSVYDTAQILGKTEGSVKVMQHRALKKLKTLLTS
jgi:RNA polymerase sigma-70 factor (ECF subfamily)